MKAFRYVLFWIVIAGFLTLMFSRSYGSYVEPFLFTSMLLPVIAGTTYFFNDYLVPRYLLKKKTLKFVLYSGYLLIVSLYLEMVVVVVAFILLARYRYDHMMPLATDIPVLLVVLYCIVFLYGFIMLTKRFLASQKRIRELEGGKNQKEGVFLRVRTDRKISRILQSDIEYVESLGDYVKIHLSSSSSVITKERISKLDTVLPVSFLRIHRSYIVNADKILSYNRSQIEVESTTLPVSRTYKKEVADALNVSKRSQKKMD